MPLAYGFAAGLKAGGSGLGSSLARYALTRASTKPTPETMKMILLRIQCSFFDTRHLAVLHLHDAVRIFVNAAVMSHDEDAALVGKNVFADEFDDVAARFAVEREIG